MNLCWGSYQYNINEYSKYIEKCNNNNTIKKNNNNYIYSIINLYNDKYISKIIFDYYYIDYNILPPIPKSLSINNNFICFMKGVHPIEKIIINWYNEKINVITNILNIFKIKYIIKDMAHIIFNNIMISLLNCDKNLCIISSNSFYKIKDTNELINIIKKII
jgi:hypothetical protein